MGLGMSGTVLPPHNGDTLAIALQAGLLPDTNQRPEHLSEHPAF